MADVTIGAKITADASQATNSVKNFKQELRLAQNEVVELTAKFGATSKEASAAAKRAAELKDAVGDAKSLVDAFNPDTKFRAFGASINTVVGGFTALQGVLGLVGVESEEVQKTLLKVQSALAISQGISQLQEGVQTFKNLGAVIQATTLFQKANNVVTAIATSIMRAFGVSTTATATSMNVLKGAIIATGIGALVVLLGVAANAMGLFSDTTDEAAAAQEDLKKSIEATNSALQAEADFLNREQKLEIARAKQRGATPKEIFDIETKYRELNFNSVKRAYDELENKNTEHGQKLLSQLKDQNAAQKLARIDFETQEAERLKAANEKADKDAAERRKKLLAEAEEETRLRQAKFTASGGPGGGLKIEIPKTLEQLQIEQEAAARAEARRQEEELRARTVTDDARVTAILKARSEERLADAEAEYQGRKALLESTGNLFSALGAIIGQQTAAGKVLAIAQATINTYVGATEVLRAKSTLPEPFGTISKIVNVAAVIATGIAAIRNIVKTPVPGGSGGSAPSALTVAAPLTPQRAQAQTTQLDQNSINALGSATTRAFVLESDISNNQERVRRLNRAARIGG